MVNKAQQQAIVGVAEHGNSAELVTVATTGDILDRRRVDLTDDSLPTHPYHHEGSWAVGRYRDSPWSRDVSLPEAIALVEQVQQAAADGAQAVLECLAADIVGITGIAIRVCPSLPSTIEACIRDNRAQTVADSVMYRQALARAAADRGWQISWYERDAVFAQAADALGCADIKPVLLKMGRAVGPPWQARHKLAAAAALAARS